jgi:NAD(P)-dependent dehydrogenase (short-subunit alcohol dehydrogenase family)
MLAAEGRTVAMVDIDGEGLATVGDETRRQCSIEVVPIVADVASAAELTAALDGVVAKFGPPTVMFANAGIERNAPTHSLDVTSWESVLQVNLTGVFVAVRHALAALIAARCAGSIVCTASPAALVGFAGGGNASYAASKGGIVAFVKSVATDYGRFGIRINAVIPGAIDTPFVVPSDDARASIQARAASQIPLGRLGRPDEIADVVMWLLSERAAYVTGAAIVCDGGLTARSVNDF